MAEDIFNTNNFTQDYFIPILNQTNRTSRYSFNSLKKNSGLTARDITIIIFYTLIVVVSVFGNLLVCNIVARKANMRRTTYVFIANLAISDFLMTVLNIPFNVARVLLQNWPFGAFMCSFVPLVQVTSVYVSTFTMMFIALDRYRVICKPLMPRLTPLQASKVIFIIWIMAIILSLPHAIFNRIETMFSYRTLIRCRTSYPDDMNQWITLITFLTQYLLPLSVTGMAYYFIIARVWSRDVLGVVTEAQVVKQAKAKWKTIKMLVIVVILFAALWLPLNVYNLYYEFTTDVRKPSSKKSGLYNSTIYFICHWLAMSSLCCNPFIYCWLNKNFRSGAYACLLCIRSVGQKLNYSFRSTQRETKFSDVQLEMETHSGCSRTDTVLQTSKDFSTCCNSSRSDCTKSKSLRIGSQNKIAKETIPMTPISEKNCSNESVCLYEENVISNHHSFPHLETSTKPTEHNSIRNSHSWNEYTI